MWGKILFVFIERFIEYLFKRLAEYKARRHEKKRKNPVPMDKNKTS